MKELSEVTAPAKSTRKMLEAEVQEKCVAWACRRGYWARKFSSISQRSVPDFLFSHRGRLEGYGITFIPRIKFACEFKKEDAPIHKDTGTMSTTAQVEEQELMRAAGWYVFECCDVEAFKRIVINYEQDNA